MTVGQAGVNPGAGLFSIAVNQGLYKKHGLDVEIIKTNTTAAVQAMLANKMQMATGAGMAAFITANLEGAPGFTLVGSWVNVFP
jgi:ABC-type nitrate/sulfonate/bicarbonate transport system substrate-binding protein